MLLIIGLGSLLWHVGAAHTGSDFGRTLQRQMGHVAWEGLSVYDLIFPLFVYIAGISQNFSLRKRLDNGSNRLSIALHMWLRAAILIVLGWMVNGPLTWDANMRFASVLGLIGLSGALSGTLVLLLRSSGKLLSAAILLLGGIWAAQYWGGEMTPSACVNARIDTLLCPGKLHNIHYDPEGVLCVISATALSLLGYLSGRQFSHALSPTKRLLLLAGGGACLIFIGQFCGPVIKNIWTPAFVLVAAGTGALLLSVLHLVCDIMRLQAWTYPLRVVGANALFVYLITHITAFNELNERLFGGLLRAILPHDWLNIGYSLTFLLLAWLLCLYLYRRDIYIRV